MSDVDRFINYEKAKARKAASRANGFLGYFKTQIYPTKKEKTGLERL